MKNVKRRKDGFSGEGIGETKRITQDEDENAPIRESDREYVRCGILNGRRCFVQCGGNSDSIGWRKVNGGEYLPRIGHDAYLRLIECGLKCIVFIILHIGRCRERQRNGDGGNGTAVGTGGDESVRRGCKELIVFGRREM